MSTSQKIDFLKEGIKSYLKGRAYTSLNTFSVPLYFFYSNENNGNSFNVVKVDSKEEAEQIVSSISTNGTISEENANLNSDLYLVVEVRL